MKKTNQVNSQTPKTSTASNPTTSIGGDSKKVLAKPIITVTEFTPGTTPQQVGFFNIFIVFN